MFAIKDAWLLISTLTSSILWIVDDTEIVELIDAEVFFVIFGIAETVALTSICAKWFLIGLQTILLLNNAISKLSN